MKKQDKRGLSTVVATVLMILLVVILVGVVWITVKNIADENLNKAGSCLNVLGKTSLNNEFTCYNSTSKELRFSINVEDVSVDGLLIGIAGGGSGKSFEIPSSPGSLNYLKFFGSTYGASVNAPGSNSGRSYIVNTTDPIINLVGITSVEIAPIMNGNVCEASDSITSIDDCALLAS